MFTSALSRVYIRVVSSIGVCVTQYVYGAWLRWTHPVSGRPGASCALAARVVGGASVGRIRSGDQRVLPSCASVDIANAAVRR